MNGYERMKKLRRMRVTKIISAVTAVSMAVTGMAVAASANPATPDYIANALGDLTRYGIVTENLTTYSHFESNFAAKNVTINNNFSLDNAVANITRTISFSVSTEVAGEFYYGIFCDGNRVAVEIDGQDYDIIAVSFDEPGTKEFVAKVPDEYKYSQLVVHELVLSVDDEGTVGLDIADEGEVLDPDSDSATGLLDLYGTCLISDSLAVQNEVFGTNKTVYVGEDIWNSLTKENDGRWSYNGTIIAPSGTSFTESASASSNMDVLMDQIQKASDALAQVNEGGDKVILINNITDSIYAGSEEAENIKSYYKFLKEHPDYVLLVNIRLTSDKWYNFNSDSYEYFGITINGGDTWDADTASRVIFNFIGGDPDKATICLGDGFLGTVIAPNARVINNSTICGAVYSPDYCVNSGELHKATYGSVKNSYKSTHDAPEETTEESTTPEESTEETTTPPEETTEETTTTPPEVTTEATTTTTTPPEVTTEATTTPEVTTEATTTTTTPPEVTTEATTTTTTPPEVTTEATTTPEVTTEATTTTTTPPEVTTEATTTPEVTTTVTTPPEVTTEATTTPEVTTEATTTTTTTPPEVTTEATTTTELTTEETTTTAPEATTEETTVPEETTAETTVPEETTEETTAPEETTAETTVPEETTSAATTTTEAITISTVVIDEDTPRATLRLDRDTPNLIIIDEDVPLADRPMSTGVTSNVGTFAIIGGAALLIGAATQVYTVIIKKKK